MSNNTKYVCINQTKLYNVGNEISIKVGETIDISRSQKETLLAKEEPSLIPLFPTMSDGELDLNISWYGLTA